MKVGAGAGENDAAALKAGAGDKLFFNIEAGCFSCCCDRNEFVAEEVLVVDEVNSCFIMEVVEDSCIRDWRLVSWKLGPPWFLIAP